MAKTHNPWHIAPGLNNVGSFQVSGAPYVTSSISTNAVVRRIQFPQVTSWVKIINYDMTGSCKVGFSALGIGEGAGDGRPYSSSAPGGPQPNPGYLFAHNYFTISSGSHGEVHRDSGVLDWKVSELWIKGSGNVAILAGLTNIPAPRCSSSFGPSWSGSAGVG